MNLEWFMISYHFCRLILIEKSQEWTLYRYNSREVKINYKTRDAHESFCQILEKRYYQ
jgi:hypothetical protein